MRNEKLKKLTFSALMAALVFATTYFLHVGVPGADFAYINTGDVIVYLTAALPGGLYGAAAAGIGSLIADLMSGAAIYAPATFAIKAAMSIVVWLFIKKGKGTGRFPLGCVVSGLVMIAGYFLYELALFGSMYAVTALPANAVQYVACAAGAVAIYFAMIKIKLGEKE